MFEPTLAPRAAVISAFTAPGITVEERAGLALCSVLARNGAWQILLQRAQDSFGLVLPHSPAFAASGPVSFVWAGPMHWLAIAEDRDGHAFQRELASVLSDAASVVDQSDGRTVLRVGGPRCRDVLGRTLPIDLHSAAFGPGRAAMTGVAHFGLHVWQVDSQPTYEFAVFRSFATAFVEWLDDAAA